MVKAKKKKSGSKGDKEKPLLTVQGVLRLERSFVSANHGDDIETIKVKPTEDSEDTKEIKLVPGNSEHENVKYKTGYEIGPGNPFPTNKPEEEIFTAQRKVEAKQEAFEALKKQSEEEKKERELKYRQENNIPEDELKPPGEDAEETEKEPATKEPQPDPKELDPDNPENYVLPPMIEGTSAEAFEPSVESHPKEVIRIEKSPVRENPGPSNFPMEGTSEENSQEGFEALTQEEINTIPAMKPLPDEQEYGTEMVLSVALEMEEKRRKKKKKKDSDPDKDAENDVDDENIIYSLDEITRMKSLDNNSNQEQGPSINQEELIKAKSGQDEKALLEAYWQFVKDNPHDFNGWTYLLQHVENIDVLDEIRTAYNSFLPLYPYCFAYWVRYSDIEKKHEHWQRSLAILHRGLEAIPMSIDLWIAYLELYHKMYRNQFDFNEIFREQCERAIMTVGMDFRSDQLWERYLEWEHERKNLKFITEIYSRLVCIPTRLYNKHWDNFIAHVRDHHPRDIMEYETYDKLRRITCKELGLTYRPDPIVEPHTVREVFLPEDKLKAGMKERIVASCVNNHEKCESQVEARIKFEDKIKRPYFHVRSIDLKQLKNWDTYLDFEIKQGHHERIVVLFERCLIPCAKYEQFWDKYAHYLEIHCKRKKNKPQSSHSSTMDLNISQESVLLRKAKWSFGTGLTNVDDLRERKCMWTLRGWKETDEDGNEIMVAEEIPKEKKDDTSKDTPTKDTPEKNPEEKEVDDEMASVCKTTWSNLEGQEAVKSVFKRACYIHCPHKALIHMKFAAFEESCGHIQAAKEILVALTSKYPLLIEASMQLIDLERRSAAFQNVIDLYKKLMKKVPQNRKSLKTWLALKMARFQFKVMNEPDKALATLR